MFWHRVQTDMASGAIGERDKGSLPHKCMETLIDLNRLDSGHPHKSPSLDSTEGKKCPIPGIRVDAIE
ncbi:unnamed protein product [Protopolystoma xenopodis]|uniref:Uncharacterized protein n=1 Tax=Protopolystoma xenopodis TaxID=117903 RepID=A0A3S5BBR6_9PLAT|nr:unnamed protein product [Protopolystoma xenopodis]